MPAPAAAASTDTTAPSLLKTGLECRVVVEAAAALMTLPFTAQAANARGTVLVIPGFGATDASTWALRHRLGLEGYNVHAWALGRNTGPRGDTLARLARRVREIARDAREPVHLVGWSLGGVLARVAAARAPGCVARVVTLGSPLSGDPRCSRFSRLLEIACGRTLRSRHVRDMLRCAAGVPVVSIYSKSDGVVDWRASARAPGVCRAIEVESSHLGLVVKPAVLDRIVSVLARDPHRRSRRPCRAGGGRPAVRTPRT